VDLNAEGILKPAPVHLEAIHVATLTNSGAGAFLLTRKHVLPNIAAPTISYTILRTGRATLIEAGLSYLASEVRTYQAGVG